MNDSENAKDETINSAIEELTKDETLAFHVVTGTEDGQFAHISYSDPEPWRDNQDAYSYSLLTLAFLMISHADKNGQSIKTTMLDVVAAAKEFQKQDIVSEEARDITSESDL